MSDVLDDFDADALQACIDPIEGSGVDPHRVDQLRALVQAHRDRLDVESMLIALQKRQNDAFRQAGYFTGTPLPSVDEFLGLIR